MVWEQPFQNRFLFLINLICAWKKLKRDQRICRVQSKSSSLPYQVLFLSMKLLLVLCVLFQRQSINILCVCLFIVFKIPYRILNMLFLTLLFGSAILKYHSFQSLFFDSVCFQNICKVSLHLGILMSSEFEMVVENSDPQIQFFCSGVFLPSSQNWLFSFIA